MLRRYAQNLRTIKRSKLVSIFVSPTKLFLKPYSTIAHGKIEYRIAKLFEAKIDRKKWDFTLGASYVDIAAVGQRSSYPTRSTDFMLFPAGMADYRGILHQPPTLLVEVVSKYNFKPEGRKQLAEKIENAFLSGSS